MLGCVSARNGAAHAGLNARQELAVGVNTAFTSLTFFCVDELLSAGVNSTFIRFSANLFRKSSISGKIIAGGLLDYYLTDSI